ncbi:hypothetical protein TUBRATIS_004880 [Tubulinosema ratisbonensis]|uniref:Uncharacterized protein n=1 Tax=Tubulinosema ratisbonensis TaxID=291195 RepID=A0A437APH4_9MICR|nr:hypothetical protein TUBRATIS_004880 [Tubulinosema ratisbonensis]
MKTYKIFIFILKYYFTKTNIKNILTTTPKYKTENNPINKHKHQTLYTLKKERLKINAGMSKVEDNFKTNTSYIFIEHVLYTEFEKFRSIFDDIFCILNEIDTETNKNLTNLGEKLRKVLFKFKAIYKCFKQKIKMLIPIQETVFISTINKTNNSDYIIFMDLINKLVNNLEILLSNFTVVKDDCSQMKILIDEIKNILTNLLDYNNTYKRINELKSCIKQPNKGKGIRKNVRFVEEGFYVD